ncbi:anti-sigma factor family protein [Neorhodopirellula pilleata]|uniref:Uncharacterized protein n=1 Tax=Neorhodopirellula pilleata TaxID=2714738 RepID=A0A5C6A0K6_9BACT|nr:hypothetical protein [Neorhodopirellula pilleata]TWT93099.1 hypothetical protein Pla100_44160 [Neorhodopirellula pilleata]
MGNQSSDTRFGDPDPMNADFTDAQLIAFLDEELAPELSSRLEAALREQPALQQRLTILRGQNLAGLHTIGAIWRRQRLSCPDRTQLTKFLSGQLSPSEADYIRFHLGEIHCRVCNANLDDLKQSQSDTHDSRIRRGRLFESSAGHLRKR